MTNEEIKLLNEMKDNCLNGAKYIDPKSMEKYNLLRKFEDRLNNWNELRSWLEEEIKRKPTLTTFIFKINNKITSITEIEERELKRVLSKLNELEGDKNE